MKKNRALTIIAIVLILSSVSLLIIAPVNIRTVDAIKILVLGACIGVLISQVFGNKS